jgi:glutathione peroxidase
MKKLLLMFSIFSFFTKPEAIAQGKVPNSIYDFKVEGLDGKIIDFANFKGKKILIVNTASKCGLTPQYEKLEKLHDLYKDKLVVIGFPANNFLFQEPGTSKEIKEFCTKNYGVSFLMASKISVKGKDMAPLYVWLTNKKFNGVEDSNVGWNFQKYLISENGKYVQSFSPKMDPMSEQIIAAIKN